MERFIKALVETSLEVLTELGWKLGWKLQHGVNHDDRHKREQEHAGAGRGKQQVEEMAPMMVTPIMMGFGFAQLFSENPLFGDHGKCCSS